MSKTPEKRIMDMIWPSQTDADRWLARNDKIRFRALQPADFHHSYQTRLEDGSTALYEHYFDGIRDLIGVRYKVNGFVLLVHDGFQSVVVYWQEPGGSVRIDRRNEFLVAA